MINYAFLHIALPSTNCIQNTLPGICGFLPFATCFNFGAQAIQHVSVSGIKTTVAHQFLNVDENAEIFRVEFAGGREHRFRPVVLPAEVIFEIGCIWNCHKEPLNKNNSYILLLLCAGKLTLGFADLVIRHY